MLRRCDTTATIPTFSHCSWNHVQMSPREWRARPLSMDGESLSFGVRWEARLFHLMTISDNGFSQGYISEEKMKVAWKNLTCFTDISLNRLLFRTISVQYHHHHSMTSSPSWLSFSVYFVPDTIETLLLTLHLSIYLSIYLSVSSIA